MRASWQPITLIINDEEGLSKIARVGCEAMSVGPNLSPKHPRARESALHEGALLA